MSKIKIGFKKRFLVYFVLVTITLFSIPQQSFAQPPPYDGTKAYITIWFDHAFATQIPAVNAMIKDKIPGAILIRTGVVGNPDYMTWQQLHYYANNHFEMIDHSITHPIITNTTSDGRLIVEILHSASIIRNQGFTITGYLSPYDIVTPNSAKIINKYYKWTEIPSEQQNTLNSIQEDGKRYGFSIPVLQHLGVGVPPGPPLNNFTAAKIKIDYAINHHTWLVLNFHQLDDKKITYHTNPKLFFEILKYIKQKVDSKQIIPIAPSDGLGIHSSPILNLNDYTLIPTPTLNKTTPTARLLHDNQ